MAEKLRVMTPRFREFPEPHPTTIVPTHAVVREIDYCVNHKGELEIFFSRTWSPELLGVVGFQAILAAVAGDRYATPERAYPLDEPYDTPLSLHSPRVVHYVIYKLKSGRNWQFARRGPPLTISVDAPPNCYFEARRVDPSGVSDEGSLLTPGAEKDHCQVAYFVADGASAHANAPGNRYAYGLNLHVDLVYGRKFLPLIIDPDIRWPGGSGGPPEGGP